MSFSILVGLALDYDIFLMSRVVEFRQLGWSDAASVSLAVDKSAPRLSILPLHCIAHLLRLNVCGMAAEIGCRSTDLTGAWRCFREVMDA